ncbi:hypothetical protein CLAFUW4_08151 [Fulvia fulva]|uniref:CENP-V/GFA domain-containing protein n=1 Tax=Passalora fulva TaxID=5499 RepID=A0A9Q8LCA1_PASFU|nr:uncharacterized protein CLAFUR5_08265 [Fulvia fulva]KAK4629425.1 hypothetical protein CLAFUR4_08156 [Fulvia fulva]KAK4630234.1 hypothetical protein CLAFUR0_08151 [Fulvia fulva]UJO14772.1 hypothetical protein CLAFUR5_08265 [Fulvia fulva]WPV12644.1 hypothetical protein CLAFUW4_08151 [Fulvia fulva]WPV27379.1 hypothetical protein CLAFUW7_08151 [Fulvia fulva]
MPKILLPSDGASGGPNATATCFCTAVQISFPINSVSNTHVCHCSDCHKIHSTMFGTNFVIPADVTTHNRGKEKLTMYSENHTTTTGNTMENHFCSVCGTVMYRIGSGFPGMLIGRVATVDDFELMESVLKPEVEEYVENRVGWLKGVEGARQVEGFAFK